MKRSAPFDTAFGPSKITPRPEWAECLLRGSFGTAFGPFLGTLIGSRLRPHSIPHSTHGGEGVPRSMDPGSCKNLRAKPWLRTPRFRRLWLYVAASVLAASILRTGFSKVKGNRDVLDV
jgi:hypothetical protein